jgi:EmrB/QacA subfamily drug resistance transporter
VRHSSPSSVLTIILVSYLMVIFDICVVITALPGMQAGLGFTVAQLSWVQNAYTLAFGGLLLLGARAGDIFGRRRTFIIGLAVFTAASCAAGLAQTSTWLIASRALQGLGAALLAPASLALLTTHFPNGPGRTKAVAYYGMVAGVGSSVGLILGGLLTDWVSWRLGFLINLPIGLVLMLAAVRRLSETERKPLQLDLIGALSSTVGMTALVYGLINSTTQGWGDQTTWLALIIGACCIAVFVSNEHRAPQPVMPLRLFASPKRSAAYLACFLYLGAMMGLWFFMTQYLQRVLGYSPLQASAAFLPLTIANFAAALCVPWLTRRVGNPMLLAAGLSSTLIGMVWVSRLSSETSYLTSIALPMLLIGVGQGLTMSPLTASCLAGIQAEDAGAASGLFNVTHELGGSLGLGVLVVVFASVGLHGLDTADILAQRTSAVLRGSAAMVLIALFVVLQLIVFPAVRQARLRGAPDHV